jgi:23S rRNA (uridine2552-2'-O)-methyltransferase
VKRGRNPYTQDPGTLAAKAQGYPARSVFKLREIDERFSLLKSGFSVLDLGAAPGSWSLYCAKKLGKKGRIVAVDLSPLSEKMPTQVCSVTEDVFSLDASKLAANGKFDVVLSDMAPSTTGSKIMDQAQSFELCEQALKLAQQLGRTGSTFVSKIFMSEDLATARAHVASAYQKCHVVRPKGTRSKSTEVFLVGLGLKQLSGD